MTVVETGWPTHEAEENALGVEAARERSLLCRVADAAFAVPIAFLRGVEPPLPVTPLPGAPPWVLGVTNVRGTVVGVVDLARFLGLGEAPAGRGRLMICGAGSRLVALAVGATPRVLDYPPAAVKPAAGLSGRLARFVGGLVPDDSPEEDTVIPVLDVARLLADAELVGG